jgi:methionyl-tRNA formyltransferase
VRVVFLGNDRWSVPSLEFLSLSPHEVARVVTRDPRPAGRGNRMTPTAVADAARLLGLPLAEVATVKTGPGFDSIADAEGDVLAVVAYGEILPASVLALPRAMPVNLHFALLPELRGAAPVQRAILEGMTATGVTTIRMDQGMDTGPILGQALESIDVDDDAGTLGSRLAAIGGRLLVDTIDRLEAGTLDERAQDDAAATFAPKLTPEERVIDWSEPGEVVARRVRALSPDPGATTRFRGKVLKVHRVSTDHSGHAGSLPLASRRPPAGTVVLIGPREQELGVMVGAESRGVVRIDELALEGRPRMSGEEFVRGYRPAGDVLG